MATSLIRWDPMAELANMRTAMDRLFEQSFGRLPAFRSNGEELSVATLGLDVYETNDDFVVTAAVPGIDPKDVDISVEDDVLTISGEVQRKEEVKDEDYLRRELHYGAFRRSLRLPPTVDAGKASATFEHGLLRLNLPKRPEARSRTIKITPAGVIEAEAGDKS